TRSLRALSPTPPLRSFPTRRSSDLDARNRITALEFADGKADVDYTYTPAGQLATIAAANGGGNNVVTTSYTYNRRGLLVHEGQRSEEHTSELQSRENLVCRLLLEKK